jgi:hypothetical protein
MTDSSGYRSCLNHAGRPQILESGNPTESTEFLDEETIAARQIAGHVITSAMQLLPRDIRDLINAYVGKDLHNFQIYVMTLLGIKLFLRSSELLSLTFEQFDQKLSIVNADEVRAVALWVQGKTDQTRKYLYIWRDEQCPEFFPLRHLLVYLAITGIKTAVLFPYLKNQKGVTLCQQV